MKFKTKIRELGTSKAIIIPSIILKALDLKCGDEVDLEIDKDEIKIVKVMSK